MAIQTRTRKTPKPYATNAGYRRPVLKRSVSMVSLTSRHVGRNACETLLAKPSHFHFSRACSLVTELPDMQDVTPFSVNALTTAIRQSQRRSADRHQLVDRVRWKLAVDYRGHLQLVQRDRSLVVVEEGDVCGIASGRDAHQRLTRRQ
jgi:hypothetical protein